MKEQITLTCAPFEDKEQSFYETVLNIFYKLLVHHLHRFQELVVLLPKLTSKPENDT